MAIIPHILIQRWKAMWPIKRSACDLEVNSVPLILHSCVKYHPWWVCHTWGRIPSSQLSKWSWLLDHMLGLQGTPLPITLYLYLSIAPVDGVSCVDCMLCNSRPFRMGICQGWLVLFQLLSKWSSYLSYIRGWHPIWSTTPTRTPIRQSAFGIASHEFKVIWYIRTCSNHY